MLVTMSGNRAGRNPGRLVALCGQADSGTEGRQGGAFCKLGGSSTRGNSRCKELEPRWRQPIGVSGGTCCGWAWGGGNRGVVGKLRGGELGVGLMEHLKQGNHRR